MLDAVFEAGDADSCLLEVQSGRVEPERSEGNDGLASYRWAHDGRHHLQPDPKNREVCRASRSTRLVVS